jgi:hypothetical protein
MKKSQQFKKLLMFPTAIRAKSDMLSDFYADVFAQLTVNELRNDLR